jgi:hypothetical protein
MPNRDMETRVSRRNLQLNPTSRLTSGGYNGSDAQHSFVQIVPCLVMGHGKPGSGRSKGFCIP